MNESKSIPEVTQSPFANGELAREPMQFMQEILQRQQRSTSRSNSSRTSRMIRGSDAAGADFHSGSVTEGSLDSSGMSAHSRNEPRLRFVMAR